LETEMMSGVWHNAKLRRYQVWTGKKTETFSYVGRSQLEAMEAAESCKKARPSLLFATDGVLLALLVCHLASACQRQ